MPPPRWPIERLPPTSRYRRGVRDEFARAGDADTTPSGGASLNRAEVDDVVVYLLVSAVHATGDLRAAAKMCGLTVQRVYAGWPGTWRRRTGSRRHSPMAGYRAGGRCVSCKSCKSAKRQHRGPRRT
jgi:hypothetical protein